MPNSETNDFREEPPYTSTDPEVSLERLQEPGVEFIDGSTPIEEPIAPAEVRRSIMGTAIRREAGRPVIRGQGSGNARKVPGAELSPGRRRELHRKLWEIDRSETGPGIYR